MQRENKLFQKVSDPYFCKIADYSVLRDRVEGDELSLLITRSKTNGDILKR